MYLIMLPSPDKGTPNTLTFTEITPRAQELSLAFSGELRAGNEATMRSYAKQADDLIKNFDSFFADKKPMWSASDAIREEFDKKYPSWREVRQSLEFVELKALNKIPSDHLTLEEIDRYVPLLTNRDDFLAYPHCDKKHSCYYLANAFDFNFKERRDIELIKRTERGAMLTPSEEKEVYELEKNTLKLHISVPASQRIAVLRAIVQARVNQQSIRTRLTEQRGDSNMPISAVEIREAGGRVTTFNQWKMKDPINLNPDLADFVIYLNSPSKEKSIEDVLEVALADFADILEPLSLPPTNRLPRFSQQALINGNLVNGLSVVQGNGDFKQYLLISGGEEKLGGFYDAKTNYAFRVKAA